MRLQLNTCFAFQSDSHTENWEHVSNTNVVIYFWKLLSKLLNYKDTEENINTALSATDWRRTRLVYINVIVLHKQYNGNPSDQTHSAPWWSLLTAVSITAKHTTVHSFKHWHSYDVVV